VFFVHISLSVFCSEIDLQSYKTVNRNTVMEIVMFNYTER